MNQTTFAAARRVMAFAELRSVRLVKCALMTPSQAALPVSNVALQIATRAAAKKVVGSQFLGTFHFGLLASEEGAQIRPLDISVDFEAIYALPENQRFSVNELKAFVSTNGMLNVWPYWREIVQSLTARSGLPPLTLPLLRIQHTKHQQPEV